MNRKCKLFTAGPVQVPPQILQEIGKPVLYHRDPEFIKIFNEVVSGIKYLFQTENDVLIFTASATGGMEAVVANLFSKGDHVLVVEQGKFSTRWSEIANSYHLSVEKIKVSWQESVTAEQIKRVLDKNHGITALFLTHCETSTGALNDIKSIAQVVRNNSKAIIIVDAISTIGVVPFKMDDWGIDVAIFSSNKGLLNPPGLAFVALNSRSWKYANKSNLPTYYFNFDKARNSFTAGVGSPFTPAISLFRGVHYAICNIKQTVLENLWIRHRNLAQAFRSAVRTMGLKIWPHNPSASLTAIEIPPPLEANQLITLLREKYNIIISKGQGKLNNKIIRVGHFGDDDLTEVISALENILIQKGWPLKAGVGLKTFYDCLTNFRK